MNIDLQLAKFREAAESYDNPFAIWVYDAVADYIYRGKAAPSFEKSFVNYDSNSFSKLIDKCLSKGLSDDEIIKSVKSIITSKDRANNKEKNK